MLQMKVSTRTRAPLEAQLGTDLLLNSCYWQNSSLRGCRTEIPAFFLAVNHGLLPALIHSSLPHGFLCNTPYIMAAYFFKARNPYIVNQHIYHLKQHTFKCPNPTTTLRVHFSLKFSQLNTCLLATLYCWT